MSSSKFAVFDIDGTLIRWQLYHAVVDKLASQGLLGRGVYKKLHEARMVWKRREQLEAFRNYELELVKAYETALPNLKVADFDKMAAEVADEYKTQVYRYTRELAKSLKQKGYVLLAISGSHQELVESVGQLYGFDHVVGTQYLKEGDHFSGRQIFVADDKASALKKLIDQHNLTLQDSYAIGDSKSDAPMLDMVDNPIAFNPDQKFLEIIEEKGWPIVIERKNVIYKLVKHGDKYLLE